MTGIATDCRNGRNALADCLFIKLKSGAVYCYKRRLRMRQMKALAQRIKAADYRVNLKHWRKVK